MIGSGYLKGPRMVTNVLFHLFMSRLGRRNLSHASDCLHCNQIMIFQKRDLVYCKIRKYRPKSETEKCQISNRRSTFLKHQRPEPLPLA